MTISNAIIVGGGAAGFFAAIHHAHCFPDDEVIIMEKSTQCLAKVKLSGGGRCNVTHACFDPRELVEFYPRGGKELRGPFHQFQPGDTMDWFESRGVPLKIESDGRVFPQSNSSQSIIDCLEDEAKKLGVKVWTKCGATQVTSLDPGFELTVSNGETHRCDKLVMATGSSRQGYALLASLGHTIVDPIPSLFTFKVKDTALHTLSGLAVKDVEVWLCGKRKDSQRGPVLATHWGVSGPAIIKLSAWQARSLFDANYQHDLGIDWVTHAPSCEGRNPENVLRDQSEHSPKKNVLTRSPFPEIPQRLWAYLCQKAGLSETQTWGKLSKKLESALLKELINGQFQISGKGVFKEEFVTCGGVDLKEINFKTMASKLCPGLHVIGEALNIDGVTGGFNFQNAWTGGYLAGQYCCRVMDL